MSSEPGSDYKYSDSTDGIQERALVVISGSGLQTAQRHNTAKMKSYVLRLGLVQAVYAQQMMRFSCSQLVVERLDP
jgi:hypothetical protein